MMRTCVCAALQEQFHTADAPRRTAVVQRSDTINGSSVHLDTHKQLLDTNTWCVHADVQMVLILTLAPAFSKALTQATCPDRQAS